MPYVLGLVLTLAAAWLWLLTFGPWRAVDVARAQVSVSVLDTPAERAGVITAFATHVYGPMPAPVTPRVTHEAIAPERAGGVAGVEQWTIELGPAGRFHLVLVLPPNVTRPPTILVQNFCGNQAAFPGRPEAIAPPLHYYPWICKEPALDPALRAMFGEHINQPPFELIAARGYALAMVYGGDVVPDHPTHARAALAQFAAAETGALAAWAWVYARALDALTQDERLDAGRIAVWGQSRQGKAALLAGALDERFAAVVALQSGRGGDALTSHRSGESVRAIVMQFPHWFGPRFRDYAEADPPVDQHQLLALVAPRPLLVGHARNDAWADPAGAYAAVQAAAPAFAVQGAPAPTWFVRAGRHGIYREDWAQTLDFLDARMR